MIRFGFTYLFTDDIKKMKWFYESILGLDLIWDKDDGIAFRIGDHQLSITYHEDFIVPSASFAMQPGWQGGIQPRISWSIEYDPVRFKQTVGLLKKNDVISFHEEPHWEGYWSYPVLDPMNNTIEITCSDDE